MKKLFLPIAVMLFVRLSAQKIVVVDSLNRFPVAYATVLWKSGITYTNRDGTFMYDRQYGPVTVSCAGYRSKTLIPSTDTVFLAPRGEQLPEITVDYHKKIKRIKPLKRKADVHYITNSKGGEILMLIKPHKALLNRQLVSYGFVVDRRSYIPKEYRKKKRLFHIYYRFNIYENIDGKPGEKIFSSGVFRVPLKKRGMLTTKVTKPVYIDEKGLFLGIECLGLINDKGELVDTTPDFERQYVWGVTPFITTLKQSPFFDAKTYMRYYKDGKRIWWHVGRKAARGKGERNMSVMMEYL